jgi:hypothetical protein
MNKEKTGKGRKEASLKPTKLLKKKMKKSRPTKSQHLHPISQPQPTLRDGPFRNRRGTGSKQEKQKTQQENDPREQVKKRKNNRFGSNSPIELLALMILMTLGIMGRIEKLKHTNKMKGVSKHLKRNAANRTDRVERHKRKIGSSPKARQHKRTQKKSRTAEKRTQNRYRQRIQRFLRKLKSENMDQSNNNDAYGAITVIKTVTSMLKVARTVLGRGKLQHRGLIPQIGLGLLIIAIMINPVTAVKISTTNVGSKIETRWKATNDMMKQ